MNILCAIATRGRPLRLAGVLHSLTVLQSGKNQIQYVVRMDADDSYTRALSEDLTETFGCKVITRPRPITLGQAWNEIAEGRQWDACAVLADKHLVMTPRWDEIISIAMSQGIQALRWNLLRDALETVLILSRKWYDTLGHIYPEWFPFWFSERWVFEVHQLATGHGIPMVPEMVIDEPTWKTQGLRDLEFWFEFFAKSRVLRIEEARKIADMYGRPMGDIAPILAEMRAADAWQKPRIKGYYETRGGPPGEPTFEYELAKQQAEAWLEQHAVREFEMMETVGAA